MQLSVPPTVTQNLARVKSLIGRGEPVRALDAFLAAVNEFEAAHVAGRARSGTEISIHECVDVCNGQAQIRKLLRDITKSDKAAIVYTPGAESKLAAVLSIIRKALSEADAAKEKEAGDAIVKRKETLFADARAAFAAGEAPKARALLRRLGEEFGKEKGVLASLGYMLIDAGFPLDAVPYLEQAIADFPRESEPYSRLASTYFEMREYEKAENTYRAAVKNIGMHPRTLTNLGKVYIAWNKREKAFEVLQQAVRLDPEDKEIAALFAKVDR